MAGSIRQPRTLRLVGAALAGTLIAPGLSACSNHHVDQYANCVDSSGRVVADYYCNDSRYYGGGGYFLYMAGSRYSSGSVINNYHSGSRIRPGDSTARAKAGLPRSGKVGGSVIKAGGIGKGSSGHSFHRSGS